MKIISTAILVLFLTLSAKTQSYNIPTTPVLRHLYNTKNEISSIRYTDKSISFPINLGLQKAKIRLIKNKNGLFAVVDGTGKVFKATNLNDSTVTFTRIDSTEYYGNNFNAIYFSNNGIIYSFGGYGFWNKNGQLIHFTPGSEWTIDKINKRYTTECWFYTYQPEKSKIYYIEYPWKEEATYDGIDKTSVIEFNTLKKENTYLGKLNDKLKIHWLFFDIDVPSLNGIIFYYERDILLLDFSKNKVYKLVNNQVKDELIAKAGSEPQTTFEDAGKIYYSLTNDSTLRSLKLTMSDFKEEPYPIYISENNNKILIIISIILIIIIMASIIIYKKRTKNHLPTTSEKEESYSLDLTSNEFNSIEINLISNLIEKSNMDSYLTLDELNTYLGIKRKTIEIQKRVRAEAINRINHKFNVNFNVGTTFIERTRSAEDRRYFNYIISKENAKIYLKKFTT